MITTLISDFSRTLLYPRDATYTGGLNDLHKKLAQEYGQHYDIFEYFALNAGLLHFYRTLKEKKDLYLFTTDVIQNHPLVRPILDEIFIEIFTANELGIQKKDPASYMTIAEKIKKDIQECVYIDDQLKNIQAAKEAGMSVIQFLDEKTAILQVQNLM